MKKFTLERMLKLPCFRGAILLTGQSELHREVKLANVMEVPDISNWATAKSVILTTAYPFRNNLGALVHLIQEFQEKNITALGIKLDRYIKQLPEEVLECARLLRFPIILLPLKTHFDQMILEILSSIIDEDYAAVKAAGKLSRRMRENALEGGTLSDVAQALSEWCEGDVFIRNASERTLAKYIFMPGKADMERVTYNRKIVFEGTLVATITLHLDEERLRSIDLSVIDEVIPSIYMILFRASLQYHTKKREEWIHELLLGHDLYSQREKETMRTMGINLDQPYVVGIIGIHCTGEKREQNITEEMKKTIDEVLYSESIWPISTRLENKLVHLFRHKEMRTIEYYERFYRNLIETVSTKLPNVCVGIGGIPDVDSKISLGYRQAMEAITFGIQWKEPPGIYSHDHLVTELLMEKVAVNSEYRKLIKKLLEPLRKLEDGEDNKLLRTLECLLSEEFEKNAAQRLYIHPKTLAYRKASIESLLGVSLKCPQVRFVLQLAIQLLKFQGENG